MSRIAVTLLLLILIQTFSLAQDRHLLKSSGEIIKLNQNSISKSKIRKEVNRSFSIHKSFSHGRDTLFYQFPPVKNINFGLFGQSWMVQWFEAPADMIIHAAGYNTYSVKNPGTPAELKLVKFLWDKNMIVNSGTTNLGYYEAEGNGYRNTTAFLNNPDRTGDWVDLSGSDLGSPFGEDLWSDSGKGFSTIPVSTGGVNVYQWVEMNELGFEPEVLRGDLIGVALKNASTLMDTNRIGILASDVIGYGGFKYYGGAGWLSRNQTWDFALDVTITSFSYLQFLSYDRLATTLSKDARTVQAVIKDYSPGAAGVASASIWYFTISKNSDTSATSEIEMNNTTGDTWEGEIPGQMPSTTVVYWLSATDIEGYSITTLPNNYKIFLVKEVVLLIYNSTDYPSWIGDYYMGNIAYDWWSTVDFGISEVPTLLGFYNYVIQIDGSFPSENLSNAIQGWLIIKQGDKGYFFSSQDYGCLITSDCSDTTFATGDFEYDYLGVAGLTGQDFHTGPGAEISPVADDPLSGWIDSFNTDYSVTYWYDPLYELGFTAWTDNIDVGNGIPIFTESSTGNVVGVRHEGTDWKTAFITYDYLGADFRSDTSLAHGDDPGYARGINVGNQVGAFLGWAGLPGPNSVEEADDLTPVAFKLEQNYPNPFNPSTTIEYEIPLSPPLLKGESAAGGFITLKVYDILGREVAALVNEEQKVGKYKVEFSASDGLASGIYFYRLKAGGFVETKKMILLK